MQLRGEHRSLVIGSIFLFGGCASGSAPVTEPSASAPVPVEAPPEKLSPPEPQPVETGQACAKATSVCEDGSCTIKLKNDCDAPLTCDGFVVARCRTPTDAVEARGRGKKTFASKAESELVISAVCTTGNQLIGTELSELKCK